MAEKFKPIGSRVIVQPIFEEKSEGGIVLPQTGKKVAKRATVLAVGPGVKEVKVGDVVLVPKYMPFLVDETDPNKRCILEEQYIDAVVNDEPD